MSSGRARAEALRRTTRRDPLRRYRRRPRRRSAREPLARGLARLRTPPLFWIAWSSSSCWPHGGLSDALHAMSPYASPAGNCNRGPPRDTRWGSTSRVRHLGAHVYGARASLRSACSRPSSVPSASCWAPSPASTAAWSTRCVSTQRHLLLDPRAAGRHRGHLGDQQYPNVFRVVLVALSEASRGRRPRGRARRGARGQERRLRRWRPRRSGVPVQNLRRHIVPNSLSPLIVSARSCWKRDRLRGALSFLGVGLRQTMVSWGNDLCDAQQSFGSAPGVICPAMALAVTVLGSSCWARLSVKRSTRRRGRR